MTPEPGRGQLSRPTSLAGPVLLLLAVCAITFALVARYTELLDPHGSPAMLSSMERFHAGAPPCLRYPVAPAPASITTAVDALAEAGLERAELSPLVGDLYARAERRELPLHPKATEDEYLDALAEGRGLFGRVTLFLKRDRLRAVLRRMTVTPPLTRTISSLPPAHRAAFEAQWARDPSLFVLPGLIAVLDQLSVATTSRRLDAVQALLEQRGVLELEALGLPQALLQDDWGGSLVVDPAGVAGPTLISLGRDRVAGGTGQDEDLLRVLHVTAVDVAPTPTGCDGKTKVTLSRAELDATLTDSSAMASSARVTPAFVNGSVTGFRLNHLRPGSLLVHAGLCDGDVVNSVNGRSLASPDKALEVYSTIRERSRIELLVTREGKPLTLVIELR